jgi:hypothetical protein
MPEYSDAALIELGKLAVKLASNKDTRRGFIKAVKTVEPDRAFPDQDVVDLREEMEERLRAEREERATEALQARLAAARQGLAGRFTEEQIQEIETKVMPKYGLSDYEAAATLYGADLAPAIPSNQQPKPSANWELPDIPGLKDDPAKAAREHAFRVIDELRAPQRSR